MIVTETITYAIYVYSLIVLFIYISPTPVNLILFFIYCFSTTWYIAYGCNGYFINNKSPKLLVTAQYSLLCTISFYLINMSWQKFKNYMFYKLILLVLPFVYIINIKFCEYIFECKPYHTFNVASKIYFFVIIVNLLYILYKKNSIIKKLR